MLTGGALFTADSEIDCIFKIFQLIGTPSPNKFHTHKFPEWQNKFPKYKGQPLRKAVPCPDLSDEGYKFLRSFLEFNPLRRIDSIRAASHPWLYSQVTGAPARLAKKSGSYPADKNDSGNYS